MNGDNWVHVKLCDVRHSDDSKRMDGIEADMKEGFEVLNKKLDILRAISITILVVFIAGLLGIIGNLMA